MPFPRRNSIHLLEPAHKYFLLDSSMLKYIVIDNKSGDFFVERFKTPNAAKIWLEGADTDYCYKIDMQSAND